MRNAIDYSSPTHEIEEILFDVKMQTVHSNFRFPDTLFLQPVHALNYKAIVNQQNGQIISVVGKNYRLITNSEGLEMGKQIFSLLYPHVNSNELIPYKVVAPNSKASAHIDLIHKDVNFNVWEQETWLPFLRISNSYNKTYALSFEIGFVRKLCSNGVLFNKDTMKLKYVHNKSNALNIKNDASLIEATSKVFAKQCSILRKFEIPQKLIFALVCHIMKINLAIPDKKQLNKKITFLENLQAIIQALTAEYSNKQGFNAYTALNVVTDIVSHQNEYKNLTGYYFSVRSHYTRPTDWIEDFSEQIKHDNFTLSNYLESTIKNLNKLKTDTGFNWRLN